MIPSPETERHEHSRGAVAALLPARVCVEITATLADLIRSRSAERRISTGPASATVKKCESPLTERRTRIYAAHIP